MSKNKKHQTRKDRKIQHLEDTLSSNAMAITEGRPKKTMTLFDIKWHLQPESYNHQLMFDHYGEDKNILIDGEAGTGKTAMSMYLAVRSVLDPGTPYRNIKIVRSLVQTRDVGFLPGTLEEKMEPYEEPYSAILAEIFKAPVCYEKMKANNTIQFLSTSFLRGLTWDDSIIIVDEAQNMTFHELDSIIGRVGQNSKLLVLGDSVDQVDLTKHNDVSGFRVFKDIVNRMDEFEVIHFTSEQDGCRSKLLNSWYRAKKQVRKVA